MITNIKWSDVAWQAALPIYGAITEHPFIKGVADGSLEYERFIFYLQQDALYIDIYSRVLAHIASRAIDTDMLETFLAFAADGVAVEKDMHMSYLKETGSAETLSPACTLYTSFLKAQADKPVEVEAAAILPCFKIYLEVGKKLLENAALENNPYRMWIETYSDPAFDVSNARAIAICDRLAEAATPAVRHAMTEAFVNAARMEWLFWDSAYKMQQWPV